MEALALFIVVVVMLVSLELGKRALIFLFGKKPSKKSDNGRHNK